jgi:hypothetical protein
MLSNFLLVKVAASSFRRISFITLRVAHKVGWIALQMQNRYWWAACLF